MKKNNGFTLIELIVVIVIMAILIGVTIGGIYMYVGKAKLNTDINNAANVEESVMACAMTWEGNTTARVKAKDFWFCIQVDNYNAEGNSNNRFHTTAHYYGSTYNGVYALYNNDSVNKPSGYYSTNDYSYVFYNSEGYYVGQRLQDLFDYADVPSFKLQSNNPICIAVHFDSNGNIDEFYCRVLKRNAPLWSSIVNSNSLAKGIMKCTYTNK